MQRAVILLIFILSFAGSFMACDGGGGTGCGSEEIDPCQEVPNCIPDLSDWKLHYKPHNADCTQCHTTCTPSKEHTFCATGTFWNVPESTCLKCHATQHKTTSTKRGVQR